MYFGVDGWYEGSMSLSNVTTRVWPITNPVLITFHELVCLKDYCTITSYKFFSHLALFFFSHKRREGTISFLVLVYISREVESLYRKAACIERKI